MVDASLVGSWPGCQVPRHSFPVKAQRHWCPITWPLGACLPWTWGPWEPTHTANKPWGVSEPGSRGPHGPPSALPRPLPEGGQPGGGACPDRPVIPQGAWLCRDSPGSVTHCHPSPRPPLLPSIHSTHTSCSHSAYVHLPDVHPSLATTQGQGDGRSPGREFKTITKAAEGHLLSIITARGDPNPRQGWHPTPRRQTLICDDVPNNRCSDAD